MMTFVFAVRISHPIHRDSSGGLAGKSRSMRRIPLNGIPLQRNAYTASDGATQDLFVPIAGQVLLRFVTARII